MIRLLSPALLLCLLYHSPAQAQLFSQLFPRGPEALKYGAYTGGHSYSYNTAYSYGLSFSPADSWRRDPFAYPAGIYPYRPYGRPITVRVFPNPETPFISVPGPDGLPMLIRPDAVPPEIVDPRLPAGPKPAPEILPAPALAPAVLPASATLPLRPVPMATEGRPARIRIVTPAGAQVWVEKEQVAGSPTGTLFQTPPLRPGKMQIYSVRAKWTQAGREVEQFRIVGVQAGETTQLNFTAAR